MAGKSTIVLVLRFVDGFGLSSLNRVSIKYNAFSNSFFQATFVPGPGGEGRAFCLINTAFGSVDFYNRFSRRDMWGVSMDIQWTQLGVGTPLQQMDFFRFLVGSHVLLGIRQLANGRLALVNESGFQFATGSAPTIVLEQWYRLEIQATFNAGGAVQVKLDGVTVINFAGIPFSDTADTLGFRFQQFDRPGLAIANMIWYDSVAGDEFVTWPGPVRVNSLLPTADYQTTWTPSSGPDCWAMVNDFFPARDPAPDGNSTYILPVSGAQYFEVQASPCFGRVMAVAINCCSDSTAGDLALSALCEPLTTPHVVGVIPVQGSAGYLTQQVFATVNPDTGGNWIDSQISGALWGVSAGAGAPLRLTAFYLEKVTSLTPQPYTCGGDYCF